MTNLIQLLSAMPMVRFFDLLILAGWIVAQPLLCVAASRAR